MDSHRITLATDHIAHGCCYFRRGPQISGTSVPPPPAPAGLVTSRLVECSAGIGFDRAHHLLRTPVRVDYCVHMARANMSRQQNPSPTRAGFLYSLQRGYAARFIQDVRSLSHHAPFPGQTPRRFRQRRGANGVVLVVDRTGSAMKPRPVAYEGNQVDRSLALAVRCWDDNHQLEVRQELDILSAPNRERQ